MPYQTQFLVSLFITIAVEVPVVVVLTILLKEKINILRIILIGILATALTIPYLWFIFNFYFDYWTMAIGGEIFVFVVETIIYWKLLPIKLNKAVLLSFVANIASILAGVLT